MDSFVCLLDIEKFAHSILDRNALDYYRSGADHMHTLKENERAFQRHLLLPRMLIDVSNRCQRTKILNGKHAVDLPVGISPTAMQRMAHPEGELASARAAEAANTVFILSTISTSSIEEVAEAAPKGIKWFQLYIYKDREVTKQLVQRAERAGFSALVLTVDAPHFGRRIADVKNKFKLPSHLKMANFIGKGDLETRVTDTKGRDGSGINNYVASMFDPSLSWKDVKWLKSFTKLPIILKGILRPDDALKGLEAGAEGIFVSNHGARQLDGVPASIDALHGIRRVVGDRCDVYLDGGVRNGTDVLKALALGAKMVFIGRPVIWGLAWKGQEGVETTLKMLKKELDTAMALSGITKVGDIDQDLIAISKSSL